MEIAYNYLQSEYKHSETDMYKLYEGWQEVVDQLEGIEDFETVRRVVDDFMTDQHSERRRRRHY